MTEYLTEQEQIEVIKNWIKQYSFVVLAGIALAIAIISGWRYWQERQNIMLNHASILFDDMLNKRAQNDAKGTTLTAEKLFSDYPKTAYGQLAALMLAREAINNQQYDSAKKNLTWVLDKSHIQALREIAALRLARLLIADHHPQDALNTLNEIDNKTFKGFANEIKGDAYLALNNPKEARASYGRALAEIPNAQSIRPLLQMKYDNLST